MMRESANKASLVLSVISNYPPICVPAFLPPASLQSLSTSFLHYIFPLLPLPLSLSLSLCLSLICFVVPYLRPSLRSPLPSVTYLDLSREVYCGRSTMTFNPFTGQRPA